MHQLIPRNIIRWRMRLLGIAVLVALAFTLQVLYSSFLAMAQSSSAVTMPTLTLPYDLMIVVAPGERILSEGELPELPYNSGRRTSVRQIEVMEQAVKVTVDSPIGAFGLLGVQQNSAIYHPSKVYLEGRWLAAQGEIVLPRSLAEREGLHLGDLVPVSVWMNYTWQKGTRYAAFEVVGIYDAFDLQPALVLFEDAQVLTAGGEANCCLFTYARYTRAQVGVDATLDLFLNWIRPAYPTATFIEARLPEQIGQSLLSRIYQPGQGLLLMIVVFVFIGVLTIAVMTYLERRKEFASLRTSGISKRQMLWLLSIEYSLATVGGLLLGGFILFFLSAGIAWLRDLDVWTLLFLTIGAALGSLIAVLLAVLYPVITSLVATVNQLLYARRIPLVTRRINHLERPDSLLVYREREENLRFLKTASFEEAGNDLLLIKQRGDQVKRGETVVLQERFFGFMILEWSAFCDGTIEVLEPGGLIGIRPENVEERFYPYPVMLLETEQRRRRIFEQAVFQVQKEVAQSTDPSKASSSALYELRHERAAGGTHVRNGEPQTRRQSNVIDYASIARAEQGSTRQVWQNSIWQRMRPLMGIGGCLILYYGLHQWALSQAGLADLNRFRVAQVVISDVQDMVRAQGNLQPRFSSEIHNPIAGELTEVFVSDGDSVVRNQKLIQVKNHAAQAALEQARFELVQAQLTYDTLRLQADSSDDRAIREQALSLLRQQESSETLLQERKKLQILALAPGTITEVYAREGDVLISGSPLFGFYNHFKESAAEREIKLMKAKESLSAAERALRQLEIRAERDGVVTALRVDIDQRVSAGENLLSLMNEAGALSADTALSLRQTELEAEQLQRQIKQLTITASCDGILSGFHVEQGEYLEAGRLLGRLTQENEILFRCYVPQSQIGNLRRGDSAEIRNLANGGRFTGVVAEIASEGRSNPQNHAVHYEVLVRLSASGIAMGTKVEVKLYTSNAIRSELGSFSAVAEAAEIAEIVTTVSGEIADIRVNNGDYLRAGEVIAILENANLMLRCAEAEERIAAILCEEKAAPLEATVARILVHPGEAVAADQLLLQLENGVRQAAYNLALQEYQDLLASRISNESILSQTGGIVRAIHVHLGDNVQPGQLLAELDNPDITHAAENADVELLKLEASYQAMLQNPGAGMQEVARLRLEQARNEYNRRVRDVDDLIVTATFDGTIRLMRTLHSGEMLSAGQDLGWIHAEQDLELVVPVDENEISLISEGMLVALRVSAFEDEEFRGVVREIATTGDILEGRVVFMVTIAVPEDYRLRSGMTATVEVLLQEAQSVLTLPQEFVYLEHIGDGIFAKVNCLINGRLIPVTVTTGLGNGEIVEIISGLREGDLVLTNR